MLHYCHTTNVYQIPCTSHLGNHTWHSMGICVHIQLHPILIAVQKLPGNPMSDEENTRYSKQIQTKNQELHYKGT